MNDHAEQLAERAILWDSRCIKTGYEPPRDLMEKLRQTFPMVELEWHPVLERWTLWERNGRELSLIMAICGPNQEYRHPNEHNTIAALDKCRVRGRVVTPGDLDAWLEDLDREPQSVLDQRAAAAEKIREGSERLYDHVVGKVQV